MKIKFLTTPYLIKNKTFKGIFRIMKICFILLFVFSFQLMALNTEAQEAVIELRTNSITVGQLIEEIEKQTDYLVVYSNREIDTDQIVNLRKKSDNVSAYLDEAFAGTDIGYDFENNYIVLMKKANRNASTIAEMIRSAQQQGKTITGKVTDINGEPIIGANIIEVGTTNGTVTDIDGNFSLKVGDDAVIRISYIGYIEQEINTTGKTNFQIVMEEEVSALDEVIVVGYGTMKKSSLTGSISRVESAQIETFPSTNVVDAMQGQAPGIYVVPSRQPGESPTIHIRGTRSLSASNSPLLIIDGMPGSWDNLVSQDIASMEILKDAAATSIYGSRASNGVVLVTTKAAAQGISKLNIEVNSYVGMNRYNFIKMQSAEKYAELIRDVMRYQTHGIMNPDLWENSFIDTRKGMEMFNATWAENYYEKGINFDWQKALFNDNSFNQGHNISISNQTDKIGYRLSYNYQEDNSYYKTVNFQRHWTCKLI
ncbi:MAG: TonB-dependent receptor plug domain-containing protein [Bacteroidales bacterium]|nr:TonB-dependent receptor plug domain-containing protein [Bacteroidales bacterium]